MPAKIHLDEALLRVLIETEQLTQAAIAVRFGCSVSLIERTCKRLGLATQRTGPRSGEKHPDWKGGRILVGRYWYVWTNTHPNRTKQNRVAEHRLVAEATLGRYLLRTEVVHHKNGNPKDNRPENLEVFQTNALHLKDELTGRIPNWTPEGKARILEGVRRSNRVRRKVKPDAEAPTQSTAHPQTTV